MQKIPAKIYKQYVPLLKQKKIYPIKNLSKIIEL